ncbi:hypothetical protein QA089_003344 [Meyerozyma guilliermondii]
MDYRWIKQVRALPSHHSHNDVLKTDYIDVNLKNSRKLIHNLNDLADSINSNLPSDTSPERQIASEMLPLHQVKEEMSWINETRDRSE